MVKKNSKKYLIIYLAVLVIGMFYSYKKVEVVETFSLATNKKVIYIDAGHGGY